ncbi:MAG: lipid-A-disaccharide synthase [Candidatus Brocadiia bacterium]
MTGSKAGKADGTKREIFIIAGETSGEQYGALLAEELKKLVPGIKLTGLGGDAMASAGVEIIRHVKDLAVVGITEVLEKYSTLKSAFDAVIAAISARRPAAVVLIDYPGFNLRLAKKLSSLNIPIVYYISPQIWAWHRSRVHDIGQLCRKILVVFDFEVDLYRGEGYEATYVGHPLLDRLAQFPIHDLRLELKIPKDKIIVGLLPGSRKQEIERLLPVYARAAEGMIGKGLEAEFFVASAPLVDDRMLNSFLSVGNVPVKIFKGRTYDVMSAADLLFIASGTATLEAAVVGTPMIVTYKTGAITYLVGKSVLNVDWLALPNIIANAEIVPELLQSNCSPEYLEALALHLLGDPKLLEEMKSSLAAVRARLGGPGASARAAQEIISAAGLA